MKKALITGVTGQDGSFLAELLLAKNYQVYGMIRRTSTSNTSRIDHLINDLAIFEKKLFICSGDLLDLNQLNALVKDIQPDEIYNLAAQSDVKVSFNQPYFTASTNALGVLGILEAARIHCPKAKIYQASTSEMFGGVNPPLNGYSEESNFCPKNPYAIAKLYAYWIVRNYRESYNMFACNGLLFNHESSRRGNGFVTKKITEWCKKWHKGENTEPLELGNINAQRDWGHAKDYVNAMYLILQTDTPDDWLVATGEIHTVREFVTACFKHMNKTIYWHGSGVEEVGKVNGETVVKINTEYFRPTETQALLGNSAKIKEKLGWKPAHGFEDVVKEMMCED